MPKPILTKEIKEATNLIIKHCDSIRINRRGMQEVYRKVSKEIGFSDTSIYSWYRGIARMTNATALELLNYYNKNGNKPTELFDHCIETVNNEMLEKSGNSIIFENKKSLRRVTVQIREYDSTGKYDKSSGILKSFMVKNTTTEEVTDCILIALKKQFGE